MMNAQDLWIKVCETLKRTLGEDVFTRWILPIKVVGFENNSLVLGVDNDFSLTWLKNNYSQYFEEAMRLAQPGAGYSLVIDALPSEQTAPITSPAPKRQVAKARSKSIGVLNPSYSFDEYVVGPNNSFAHAAAKAVAEQPGLAYNPLFIYGGTGLGKTHLMQAVGNYVLKHTAKTVAYLSTESLLNEYVTAIQNNTALDFRAKYRHVDLLLVDDIQFLQKGERLQEEFFNTFNELYQNKKQIILTCDRPATEIAGLQDRLVSRFNAGLATEIEKPSFETRLAILRYKQANSNQQLPDEVLTFIAENVKSNVRALEGAVNRAAVFYKAMSKLPIEELRHILRDLLDKENEEDITIESIKGVVSEYFDIRKTDLSSKDRQRSVAMPRQIAMYLCRKLTHASLPDIGEAFGKVHATVMYACSEIQGRLTVDEELRRQVRAILNKLGQDPSAIGM